jgi:hypothetical protein
MYGGDRRVACACGLTCSVIRRSSADATAAETSCRGYVLVGLRDYEAPNHRLCDLLEVYS